MADDEVNPLGTPTTNYGWTKPTVGADVDVWGGYLNADLDGIDTTVKSVSTVANAAYPASNPSGYQTAAQVTAAIPAPYVLPTASTSVLGGVKVDGSTIAINSGVISSTLLGGATISSTPPASPQVGQLWYDNVGGQTYVWYNDGNSSQWVSTTNQMGGGYLPLTGGTVTGNIYMTAAAGTGLAIGRAALGIINVAGQSLDPANSACFEHGTVAITVNKIGANGPAISIMQGGTIVGSITVANASSTAYNTSSDVRLKTDAQSFDAGPILDATEVYNFEWTTAPGVRAYGVMAQEAVEVFPDAVTHDEARDHWGVDYSKYIPLLISEIKALRVRVAQLEAAR